MERRFKQKTRVGESMCNEGENVRTEDG